MITIRSQSEFENIIANTPSNEMIRIYPKADGTPYEISSGWNLPSNAFIQGVANPKVKYVGNSQYADAIIFIDDDETTIENVRIKGLTLIGNTDTPNSLFGFRISNCGYTSSNVSENKNGVRIEDCVIQDCNGEGLYVQHMYNSIIKNVEVFNCTNTGILFNNTCKNNILINNKIHHNNNYGIQFGYDCIKNIINENHIMQNGSAGITLNIAQCNMIVGNTITANSEDGIYIRDDSDGTVISGNYISDNKRGFYCETSSHNLVTGNQFISNEISGISLDASDINTVVGNNINKSDDGIVALNGSRDNTITGNTIVDNNNLDIYLYGDTSGILYSNIYDSILNNGDYILDNGTESPSENIQLTPIYNNGIKYSEVVSETTGNSGINTSAKITEYDNYYELLMYGSGSEAIISTDEPVDMTKINRIIIEFEIEGNINTGEATLSLSNYPASFGGFSSSGYTAGISQSMVTNGTPPMRISYELDVSEAYGLVYPRISLKALSGSSSNNIAKLRIYSIIMY